MPDALLAAALGLTLSYAKPGIARQSAGIMVIVALAVANVPIANVSDDFAFTACWVTIFLTALSVHIPTGAPSWLSRAMALNCGLWAGLVTHVQGGALSVVMALPLVLLYIPGQMLIRRNWGIAIKVACSWLIAIAALEFGLNFVHTPGYKPDHMD